jgi:ADP-heptose:LPS heptosyltransferase
LRLLIYYDGALGDFLLSLPVIQSLSTIHRASEVHLTGRPHALSLVTLIPFINKATLSESLFFTPLYSNHHPFFLPSQLYAFLSHFSIIYVFSRRKNSPVFKNIQKLSAHAFHIHTVPEGNLKIPVTDYQMGQIKGLVNQHNPLNTTPFLLSPSQEALKKARDIISQPADAQRKVFTIHPGSGGRKKCWPLPFFIEWMKRAEKKFSPHFLILSGPAEENLHTINQKHLSEQGLKNVRLVESHPLPVVTALLSLSTLYIGNDSGISHLASYLTPQVITLFGPTDPRLWAPKGKNVTLITTDASCAPCPEFRYRSCREQKCLTELTVHRVWNKTLTTVHS